MRILKVQRIQHWVATTHITDIDSNNKGRVFKAGQRMATFREQLWGIDPQKEKAILDSQFFSRIKNQVFGFGKSVFHIEGNIQPCHCEAFLKSRSNPF